MKRVLYVAASLAVAFASLAFANSAEAALFRSAGQEEIPVPPGGSPSDVPLAGPVSDGMVPCCDPCITYKYRCLGSRRWACCDATTQVLRVVDPTSGSCCEPCCYVDVPVCVPCCCDDVPSVCAKGKVVVYEWCCGYKVKVVFQRCGKVKVIENAH